MRDPKPFLPSAAAPGTALASGRFLRSHSRGLPSPRTGGHSQDPYYFPSLRADPWTMVSLNALALAERGPRHLSRIHGETSGTQAWSLCVRLGS